MSGCGTAVWDTLMFITVAALPGQRKRTEDHFFMRSRKLHRDEDMVEDALRSKVGIHIPTYILNYYSVLSCGCTPRVYCGISSLMMLITVGRYTVINLRYRNIVI